MGRWGDFQKGPLKEHEEFNVSYDVALPNGTYTSGKVKVQTKEGKTGAGQRVTRQLQRAHPGAVVRVRMIWKDGMTPGGIWLPAGMEWIDDEVEGKGKKPR